MRRSRLHLQSERASARGLGTRRNLVGPARIEVEGLEAKVQADVEFMGLVDGTPEVFDEFQSFGRRSIMAYLRPGLSPELHIDAALVRKFEALGGAVAAQEQEIAALRTEMHEAEGAMLEVKAAPTLAWLIAVLFAVLLTSGIVVAGASALVAFGVEEYVVRPALGEIAAGTSFLVAGALAISLVASVVGTVLTATLGTWGRLSTSAKVAFVACDLLYAASFLGVRLGHGHTNWWAQFAFSGFEVTLIAMATVMLTVVGRYLKRADRARRPLIALRARLARLTRAEALAVRRLRDAEERFEAVALVVQEREEAAEELRTAVELAESTAAIGVMKGIARNRQKAAEDAQ